MATVILPCNCRSPYQDKVYGVGNRVHNECEKKAKCTVCGATKEVKSVGRQEHKADE